MTTFLFCSSPHFPLHSSPFHATQDLLPMCYRCSTTNQLFNTAGSICTNCRQPFVFSFVSFEVLPVVEFFLAEGISDDEAMKLIQMEAPRRSKNQGWKEAEQGSILSIAYIRDSVHSTITLLGSFSSFEFLKFSVNCKEPLSNGPYASKIGLSIMKL